MILDIETGVTYEHVIYKDAQKVILWRPDFETELDREHYDEIVTFPREAPGWAKLLRYQESPEQVELPTRAKERQAQIAAYAAKHGGSIVHQSGNRETGLSAFARRARRVLHLGPS